MNRELIMSTLFARLTSPPLRFQFTADITAGDPVLANVSDTTDLLLGMPVSGRGMQEGAQLVSLNPVTLSLPPSLTDTTVTLTQGIATPSRLLMPIGEIPNLPALCLVEGHEVYPSEHSGFPRTPSNVPQLVALQPYAWLYASSPSPNTIPNAIVNVLIDAIDKVMLPERGVWQNLGLSGLHHCRIEGQTLRAAGVNGQVSARIQFVIQAIQGIETTPLP